MNRPQPQPPTILLVEDDRDAAIVAEKLLCRDGYQTHSVATGGEALDWLENNLPELMLLDYSLPDMRGDKLVDLLEHRGRKVPFIVATGYGSEDIAVDMMKRGARDYLVKGPAFIDRLSSTVSKVLEELKHTRHATHAAQTLRENEERLQMVVEGSQAGIWAWDIIADASYWSPRLYEMVGRSPSDAPLGLPQLLEMVHPDDRQMMTDRIEGHLKFKAPYHLEVRFRNEDGHYMWMLVYGQCQRDESGRPLRMVGYAVDITEHKKVAEKLRLSEERYRLLIDHAPDAILVHQQGRVAFANPACLRLFGAKDESQLLGKNVFDLVHPEYRDVVQHRYQQIVSGQVVPLMKQKIFRLDGSELDVEATGTPYLYEGQPAAQVIFRDIGVRVRAEQEARQHQAQLAHVLRVSTMGNIVSELAHEINQPLYAIANYASASKQALAHSREGQKAELGQWIAGIADQANRAGEIIRRLARFVRKGTAERTRIKLDTLLGDIAALIAIDAQLHGVVMRLHLDLCQKPVYVDRVQIEQVAVNLMINAIEAVQHVEPGKRELTLTCCDRDDFVEVTVRDTGPSVTEEDSKRLFEPFFTTKPEGMGMGLPISRSIIEAHGGRLWAERNPDTGITFRFTVPVVGDIRDVPRA